MYSSKQRHAVWQKNLLTSILLPLFIFVSITSAFVLSNTENRASAATSSTLNFQGRLLTSAGGLVPDGSYNIEFKLYNAAAIDGGESLVQGACQTNPGPVADEDCLWVESRTGGNTVTVANGYFSVYLGSVNAFPGTINWDQELWLGMNIGGIGAPTWDGEMTPRFKLTAVPYAFRAGALTDASGNAKTADDFAQLAPSSIQTVNAAIAALRLNQTGTGSLLQLQGNSADVFTVDKTGGVVAGAGITVGNSTSTTAGTIRWTGSDLEVYDGGTWVSLTQGGAGGVSLSSDANFISAVANLPATATATPTGLTSYTSAVAVSATAGSNTFVAPADGSFRNCLVVTNANRTTGTATLRWRVNGVSVGAGVCVIDGTNIRTSSSAVDSGVVTFLAGDTITVAIDSNTFGPANTEFTVYWGVEYNSAAVSTYFEDGGNSFAGTATLGTTDNFGLDIITNNATALSFTSAGDASFTQSLSIAGGIDNNSGGITEIGAVSGLSSISSASSVIFDLLNPAAGTTFSILNSDGTQVAGLSVEGNVSATGFSGSGAGLTGLDADEITTGTINDLRLSSNVALLNQNQTFTGVPTFDAGLILGNSASTTSGAIRWSGTDFEGYDGAAWVSLTGSGASTTSPAMTTVNKTASESLNTSTTLQDDNQLKFSIGANETWSFRFVVQANTPIAAGIKFAVTAPSGATCQVAFIDQQTASSESGIGCGVASAALTGTGANEVYEVVGTIVNGINAGDVTLQWAQAVSNGSNTTVLIGSYLTASINGGAQVFMQGGNAFAGTAVLGTTDAYALNLIAGNATALSLATNGNATFTGEILANGGLTVGNIAGDGFTIVSDSVSLTNGLKFDTDTLTIDSANNRVGIGSTTPGNLFSINDAATADANAQALIFTDGTTNKGLVIQGTTSQSASLFEVQDNSGNTLAGFDAAGGLVLGLSTVTSSATVSRSVTLPDEAGTICLSNSNSCGYLHYATGTPQTDNSNNNVISVNKTSATGSLIDMQRSGTAVFTVANSGALQIQATSSTALDIRNASGVSYFTVDANTGSVVVGSGTAAANGVLFVLDTRTADPGGVDGGMYYNSTLGKNRCYENGAWKNCVADKPVGLVAVRTTNTGAIANAETQVLSYSIPANTSAAGDTYRIRAYATRTGTNGASPTIRVRVGPTTLTGNIAATLTGLGNTTAAPRVYEGLITIRTTGGGGTVGGGLTEYANAAGNLTTSTTPVAVDTTASNLIELTMQSGNVNNNYTFTYVTIEKLNNQ